MNAKLKEIQDLLDQRKAQGSLRSLCDLPSDEIDFKSNDYLGLSRSFSDQNPKQGGSTGSRLISGNHKAYSKVESYLSEFYKSESALIFNSGYAANTGLIESVGSKEDLMLFDELSHVSIREGLRLSRATSYKFRHNDLDHLGELILRHKDRYKNVFVILESIYSMDGDQPDLLGFTELCEKFDVNLIVDEAHAVGVFGSNGEGLVVELGLENRVFARVITFGKAIGLHGAAVLGPALLKDYLVNFAKPLIYTTALPEHDVSWIQSNHELLARSVELKDLKSNIKYFKTLCRENGLNSTLIKSDSAIQAIIIGDTDLGLDLERKLLSQGFGVKLVLPPTVKKGTERLRISIHSYNTKEQIKDLVLEIIKWEKRTL